MMAVITKSIPVKLAFKIAASIGFQEAAKKAKAILLEPIMKLEVVTPEDFMGEVIGDINSRRGKIETMDDRLGAKIIRCFRAFGGDVRLYQRFAQPDARASLLDAGTP